MQHLHTDLSPAELFRLAQAMAQVEPSKITTCVVQGGIGDMGGASVVLPYVDQARRLGDDARKDATIKRLLTPSTDGGPGRREPQVAPAAVVAVPPAGFEPAAPGTGNQCSIP